MVADWQMVRRTIRVAVFHGEERRMRVKLILLENANKEIEEITEKELKKIYTFLAIQIELVDVDRVSSKSNERFEQAKMVTTKTGISVLSSSGPKGSA